MLNKIQNSLIKKIIGRKLLLFLASNEDNISNKEQLKKILKISEDFSANEIEFLFGSKQKALTKISQDSHLEDLSNETLLEMFA